MIMCDGEVGEAQKILAQCDAEEDGVIGVAQFDAYYRECAEAMGAFHRGRARERSVVERGGRDEGGAGVGESTWSGESGGSAAPQSVAAGSCGSSGGTEEVVVPWYMKVVEELVEVPEYGDDVPPRSRLGEVWEGRAESHGCVRVAHVD